ncbi:MAG: STAS domain-containing protein [Ignavibacteriales bacterium]|nr:STAS domain-containing protein [Ignavibacteriales bacterium]
MRAITEDFKMLHVNDLVIEVVNLSRATYKEASQLKKNLDDLIMDNQKKVIVDLSQCEFIDSTFLGVLVLSLKSSAKIGGDIRLIKPAEVVKTLMEKAGTLNVFNLYDSMDEAIRSYEVRGDKNYYLGNGAPILV